ncbi:GDSL-type esterase/lipase family protein [Corynebacterium yonathiae]|uniref:GDSL-type esterase/lipase family protein n=1 Tax=Corynebacterium yonathiae TaxID=2913504 RepID=A0ABU8Y1N3_9CORY|nr:GDSL-type esterase/lipase family protein [uncultured Corynebacterium sp.]
MPARQSNVGRELGRVSGQHVANYACSAAKAAGQSHRKDFGEQINGAIANGDLNDTTKNVLIQFGANNLPEIVRPSLSSSNPYFDGMKHSIQRVRQAAPNAQITVVGYPAISARNGAVCPVRTSAPGSTDAGFNLDYAGLVRTGEDQVNSAMYKAARANGVQYYDPRADSINHGRCAPDSTRWVSGKWEYSVPHNLFNHLTHLGNRNVAQLLNSKVLAH